MIGTGREAEIENADLGGSGKLHDKIYMLSEKPSQRRREMERRWELWVCEAGTERASLLALNSALNVILVA